MNHNAPFQGVAVSLVIPYHKKTALQMVSMTFGDLEPPQRRATAAHLVAKTGFLSSASASGAVHHVGSGDNSLLLKSQTKSLGVPEGIL